MTMVNIPSWFKIALSFNGLKEIPGPKHNPVIMGWIRDLKGWFKDDETPWCGTFVANAIREAGLTPVPNWFRAKAWLNYGEKTTPRMGAIGVKGRVGGGHVFFYAGEDATHYHILGGNQKNMVSIVRIPKKEVLDWRWPTGYKTDGYSPRIVSAAGVESGGSEA